MSRGPDFDTGTTTCPPPVTLTNAAAIALRDSGTLDLCTVYRISDPEQPMDGTGGGAPVAGVGGVIVFKPTQVDEIPMDCEFVSPSINAGMPFPCTYFPDLGSGRITHMHDPVANNFVTGSQMVIDFPWGSPQITNSKVEHSILVYSGGTVKGLELTKSSSADIRAGTVEDVFVSRGGILEHFDGILRDSTFTEFGMLENKTGGLTHRVNVGSASTLSNQGAGTIEDVTMTTTSNLDFNGSSGIINDLTLSTQSDATITDQGPNSRIERSGSLDDLSSLIQTVSGNNNTVWGIRASNSGKVRMSRCEGVEYSYSTTHSYASISIDDNGTAGDTAGAGGRFRYLNINSNAGLSFKSSQGTLVERVEASSDAYFLCSGNTDHFWRGLTFGSGSRVIMRNGLEFDWEESEVSKEAVIDADNNKAGMYWKHLGMEGGDITADNAGIWLEMVSINNVGLLNALNSGVGSATNRLLEVKIDTGGRVVVVSANFTGRVTRFTIEDNAQISINNLGDEVDSGHVKGAANATFSQPAGTGQSRGYDLRGSVVFSSNVQDNNVILP